MSEVIGMTSTSIKPETMRAARVVTPGEHLEYKIQTIPVPTIRPTELLLKVKAAGFCHTDTAVPRMVFGQALPFTGSHEPAGEVVAVGSEARRHGKFVIGSRVAAVNTARWCEDCPECKYYDPRYCAKQHMIGLVGTDGAFADYCVVDASRAALIPDTMSYEQAAPMSCTGVTAYSAIKRANLKPGDVIGFSGIGALGILAVQMAKALGLKVVGVDVREGPLSLASSLHLKPDLLLNASKVTSEEGAKMIEQLRPAGWDRGGGCDAIVNLNQSEAGLKYSTGLVRNHGTLVLTAGPPIVSFSMLDFIFRQINVFGTQNGSGQDLRETIELCTLFSIQSSLQLYTLDEENLQRMVADTHKAEWSGKAVVVV